jgi:DNA-binding CsgD family transcriptional regulator/PAS domain-containing protein
MDRWWGTSSEFETWSDGLVDAVYAALLGEAPWDDFLTLFVRGLPNGKATLFVHDLDRGCGQLLLCAGMESEFLRAYSAHYSQLNPWMRRIRERPVGVVKRSDAMFERQALLRTEFYAGFLRPQGIEAGHGMTLHAEGGRRFMLSVLHADSSFELDEPMTRIMTELRPHLCRAFQFARRGTVGGTPSLHRGLVDALGMGVLHLCGDRRVAYANPAAQALLDHGDGLGLDASGRLRVADAVCDDAVAELLCLWGPAVRTTRIVRRNRARPLQVVLFRPSRTPAEMFFGGSVLVLMVIDPGAPPPPNSDAIGIAYGLSPAERRVVDGLLSGRRLDDIARAHGTSRETVRTQLHSVFDKMDVEGQADVIREALRSPSAVLAAR